MIARKIYKREGHCVAEHQRRAPNADTRKVCDSTSLAEAKQDTSEPAVISAITKHVHCADDPLDNMTGWTGHCSSLERGWNALNSSIEFQNFELVPDTQELVGCRDPQSIGKSSNHDSLSGTRFKLNS